ncbi:hypothetical protein LTR97_004157 [Elasticomyces elasticus]|uniref:Uncharacterized protein n=1 Tax=Elasticomyces elasticus TaxID=574655 RepID=A0AAN7W8X7_9PEZI|nr:hypothetical protein LTR97_004157 [Elasticomyces elasticus]
MAGTQPLNALLPVRKASTTTTQAVSREASKTTNEPLQTTRVQPARASKHNTGAILEDLAEVKLPGKNVGSSVPIDMIFSFNYTTMMHQGAEHEVSAGYKMVPMQRRFNDIITINLAYPVLQNIIEYIDQRFNQHEYKFQNEQEKEQVAFRITAMQIQWDDGGEKVELCEANWQDICVEFRKLLFGQGVVMAKVEVDCKMAA